VNDLLSRLAALQTAEPSASRSIRIRAHAHATLRRHARRPRPRDAGATSVGVRPPIWLGAAAGLGVAWLAQVLMLAVRVLAAR